MKYQKGKIKTEHHILKDFSKFLLDLEKIESVKRIIPGRISRQQKGTAMLMVSFSYFTTSGLKYNLKKGATVQEVFIICDDNEKEKVFDLIQSIINTI